MTSTLRHILFLTLILSQTNCFAKKTIKLNPDTSDNFIISFMTKDYNILVGYNCFLTNLPPDMKTVIQNHIDSIRILSETIDVNTFDKLWTTNKLWFFLHDEAEKIIKQLLDNGNAIIVNNYTKVKTDSLTVKKEGSKKKRKIAYVYRDKQTGIAVFEHKIYWVVCGGVSF